MWIGTGCVSSLWWESQTWLVIRCHLVQFPAVRELMKHFLYRKRQSCNTTYSLPSPIKGENLPAVYMKVESIALVSGLLRARASKSCLIKADFSCSSWVMRSLLSDTSFVSKWFCSFNIFTVCCWPDTVAALVTGDEWLPVLEGERRSLRHRFTSCSLVSKLFGGPPGWASLKNSFFPKFLCCSCTVCICWRYQSRAFSIISKPWRSRSFSCSSSFILLSTP